MWEHTATLFYVHDVMYFILADDGGLWRPPSTATFRQYLFANIHGSMSSWKVFSNKFAHVIFFSYLCALKGAKVLLVMIMNYRANKIMKHFNTTGVCLQSKQPGVQEVIVGNMKIVVALV